MKKVYKAINFDLSTKALKEHFGENTASAYAKIKEFMLENGFEHRQYSGYKSIQAMDNFEIYDIIKKLHNTYSWLKPCVVKFDVTNVSKQYDFTFVFEDKPLNEKTILKENHKKEKDSLKRFSKEQIERIRQKAKQKSKEQKPEINKDKGFEREF